MTICDHNWGDSLAADRVLARFAGMRPNLLPGRGLMILQGFIDDSRDHNTGAFVLAGYIAPVEKWAAFAKEWESLLPLATQNKKGVHRFKMSEMNARGRMDDVAAFHAIIAKHADMGVAAIIDKNVVREAVDALTAAFEYSDASKAEVSIEALKVWWRDPFFFAFRALMDGFHQAMAAESEWIPFRSPVDFYFDREQRTEDYIRKIWQDYIDRRPEETAHLYGRKPQFEDEEEFLPLQAADFLAWWVRKWANEFGPENAGKGAYSFSTEGRRRLPMLFMTVSRDQIQQTVAQAIGVAVQEHFMKG